MGAKQKYNEPTVMVSFRCPISKVNDFRKIASSFLDKLKKDSGFIKISEKDRNLLSLKKYSIKKIKSKVHVCRTVENARGKFNVLLAQDILGMNCEMLFIDGNTLNNERDNLKPVNRNFEYFY